MGLVLRVSGDERVEVRGEAVGGESEKVRM